jgi:isoquinoline 1-oxidoreductase alpha subunit
MSQLIVNGVEFLFSGESEMPMLLYPRDIVGLTRTKFGCGGALCGCCTVHLDV